MAFDKTTKIDLKKADNRANAETTLEGLGKKLGDQETKIETIKYLTIGILVAIVITFITLLFTYLVFVHDSFKEYSTALENIRGEQLSRIDQRLLKLENK